MSTLSATSLRQRYLVLLGARWLPAGLVIPVMVLLLIDRGFSLAQIGVATAMQGWLVFLLELPTGGLADAIGQRRVLIVASCIDLASVSILAGAHSITALAVAWSLQGIYRALDSGPLDSWYVDAALSVDESADVEGTLASGGAVLGAAIALGAVLSGALVSWSPLPGVEPMVVPLLVAIAVRAVNVILLLRLLSEVVVTSGLATLRQSVRQVPGIIRQSVSIVRGSRVLMGLVGVELLWGFGMTSFETLLPPRLAEAIGGTDSAARILGPAVAAAWLVSAVAASQVPRMSRRLGPASAAMILHAVQAAAVVGMALAAGPVGVITFYLVVYAMHGAANPVWKGLLHRRIPSGQRTTVASVASMVGMPSAAVGGIVLGALADRAGVATAMLVGAVALLGTVPMYLPARREARRFHPAAS